MKVVALIPAYNCENTIAKVVLRAMKYVDLVIVYDDGSTDDTLKIAEAIGAEVWGGVKNRGKGFALSQLFQKAKKYTPQAIVTLDADGQHIADEIPKLLKPLKSDECDVVVGKRIGISKFRQVGAKILNFLVTSSRKYDAQSGFRAYNWKAIQEVEVKTEGFAVDQQVLLDLKNKGLRIKEVEVATKYDKYSNVKNPIGHFLEVFNFFFLRRPLLNLGSLGLIGFVIGLWKIWEVINTWNLYQEFAIGTFLFSMLTIILGALAFFTGIILHVILSVRKMT